MRLSGRFYRRPTVPLGRDLLGKVLFSASPEGVTGGRIVETEAYLGDGDPACHAARGQTERNRVMFGRPGVAYVYFIYGMYNCFNVVTEPKGVAGAVLIRALEPLEGVDLMQWRRGRNRLTDLASGPGKLCIAMGIGLEDKGCDLTGSRLWIESRGRRPGYIATGQRIGINRGQELPWRFTIAGNPHVSVKAS